VEYDKLSLIELFNESQMAGPVLAEAIREIIRLRTILDQELIYEDFFRDTKRVSGGMR